MALPGQQKSVQERPIMIAVAKKKRWASYKGGHACCQRLSLAEGSILLKVAKDNI